jgi:hypothetical protein
MDPGRRWCADVAAVLLAASDQTARLALRIAEDWLDDRGREWAERAGLLHRELDRMATDAAHLGAQPDPAQPDPAQPVLPTVVAGTGRRGPRLGGTAGERVDDTYGMRIAELPPG